MGTEISWNGTGTDLTRCEVAEVMKNADSSL